jgi:hypothetical protein
MFGAVEPAGALRLETPTSNRPVFSHPSEEMFAQILDFYGIEWVYEPVTFPLEWDEDHHVTLAFTPDFYLPQQGLYIELTTLRPQLVTIKNRKMRLMAQLYPEVKIKIFKRKEMRELMIKYGLHRDAQTITGDSAQKNIT